MAETKVTKDEIANRTKYINFGYSKTAMSNGSTIGGIPNPVVQIPVDWVSGTDIVLKCTSRNTASGGVVARRLTIYRFRDGTALTAIASTSNVDRTVSSTNVSYSTLYTIAAANIAAGDGFSLYLERLGADGSDTNTGIEDCDAAWIEYTADS